MSADRTNVHGPHLSDPEPESIVFDYEKTSKLIDRTLTLDLTPGEFWILRLIFDATVGNSKEWAVITTRQFAKGVFSSEDREWYLGCIKMSPTTRTKNLRSLEEFGHIRIRTSHKGAEYALARYLLGGGNTH